MDIFLSSALLNRHANLTIYRNWLVNQLTVGDGKLTLTLDTECYEIKDVVPRSGDNNRTWIIACWLANIEPAI